MTAALRPAFWLGGLAVYLALRLIEPLRLVRLGVLLHGRIGHLAANTDLFLRRVHLGLERRDCAYVLISGSPANRQLFRMIERVALILRAPLLGVFFNRGIKPWIAGTRFHVEVEKGFKSNEYGPFNDAPPQLAFTPDEDARGRRELAAIGVPPGAPFVCFHSRDHAYLVTEHPYRTEDGWSYLDFRNCSLANYLPAARALAARGLPALRMGHVVAESAPAETLVIDYSTRHRSDFMDVWLLARCKFFLGNTTGLTFVCVAFGVPVAMANMVPLGSPPVGSRDLFIPKLYRDRASGRTLSFPEIVSRGLAHVQESGPFAGAGVELVENTPQEIQDLAEEMDARLDGTWAPKPGDEELQARYRALFAPGDFCHGFRARLGAKFLREHAELLG